MAIITLSPSQIAYVQQINTKVVQERQIRGSLDDSWGSSTLTTKSSTWSGTGDNFSSASYVYPTTDKSTAWGSWSTTSQLIRTRDKTETIKHKQMLVQFDTSGIEGTITGATLRFYATSGGSTAASVDVSKITEAWSTSTVTWSNKPDMTTILSEQSLPLTTWTAFDVSGALDGYGFALYDDAYGDNQKLKEIPKTGNLAPQLLVTYTPYNSRISAVTESVEMNGTAQGTVTLEKYNDSYTHTVKVSLGTESQTFENVDTTVSFTLPASWIYQVTNASKGVATVSCWTYDTSGNQVGAVSSATFYAVVPEGIVPSATLTGMPINENEAVNGWGILLQGYSKIKLTSTGTAGTGATVTSYTFSGSGVSQSGADYECTSNVLSSSGEQTWQVTVTDSRGRTATASFVGEITPYFAPALSVFEAYRCLEDGTRDDFNGTYGRAQGTYSFASCNGNNTATGTIKYNQYGYSYATTVTEGADSGTLYQFGNGGIDLTKSYVVTMTVTDALGASTSAQAVINITTGSLFIGLNGDRISFGKPVSRAGLDCHFPAYFRDTVTLEGEYPDIQCIASAGGHNAIYRGKYLGDEVTDEQWSAISAGTFENLYIGDYWTIGNMNYRIAAFDYYYGSGDTNCTTHHVTIVPDTGFYTGAMNSSGTASGAYVGSKMYKEGLANAKTTINDAFGSSHILNHRVLLQNAVSSTVATGASWYDSTVELMTERNVVGNSVYGGAANGTTINNVAAIDNVQFPLFAYRYDLIANRQTYWLRDFVSSSFFSVIYERGTITYDTATGVYWVRPSFSIC